MSPVRARWHVAAALVWAVLAVGCTRVGAPPAALAVHELRIADTHEPATLDPLVAFTQADIAYDQLFCQTLVRAGGAQRVQAQLITRVPSRANGDISADGRTITYHLRRDVRFADGVRFTSRDVAFTFRALFDARNHAASLDGYNRVRSLETPDPFTVRVTLRAPWNAAVGTLFAAASYAYGILPAHAFRDTLVTGSAWEQTAFGTGPFRVVRWQRGEQIVLERNPYYRPRPRLDRIVLKIIPNYETARNSLVSGAVDIAPVLPAAVNELRRRSGIRVVVYYLNGVKFISLAVGQAPTNDVRVRRAVAAAVDPLVLTKIDFGLGRPVRSFLAPPIVTWRRQPAVSPYAYDPAAARRTLEAAGWHAVAAGERRKDGRPLSVTYVADAEDASDVARAVAIEAQLAAVGIAVNIKSYARAVYQAPDGPIRSGQFNLADGAEISGDDPEQSAWGPCTGSSDWGTNFGRYCSRAYDALFADQATTADAARRERDFDAMERLVIADVAMVPLVQYTFIVGISERVVNYGVDYLEFPAAPETWDVTSGG